MAVFCMASSVGSLSAVRLKLTGKDHETRELTSYEHCLITFIFLCAFFSSPVP